MMLGGDNWAMKLLQVASVLLGRVACLEVLVRPNGAPLDEARAHDVDSLASLREQVAASSLGALLGEAWWLADLQGRSVTSWEAVEALAAGDRHLSAVPEDKQFQWSPRAAGERFSVEVEGHEGLEMETVTGSPRLFLMHNLFSEEESFYLIERAMSKTGHAALTSSGTGFNDPNDPGKRNVDSVRTSDSAFDSETAVSRRLIKRAFEALRIPFDDGLVDGLQILRYKEGQAYIPHTDWFAQDADRSYNFDTTTPNSTNRLATVFLYLWPPPSGGYTVFPRATMPEGLNNSAFVSTGTDHTARTRAMMQATKFYSDKQDAWEMHLTRDCYTKLSVKPVRLGASLFYHQDPMTGRLMHEAEHGACPSFTGTKWGANLWVWSKPRQKPPSMPEGPAGGGPPPQVQVIFENNQHIKATIEFSFDGVSWKPFGELMPGTTFGANAFGGHKWRFMSEDGEEMGKWETPMEDLGMVHVLVDGTMTSQVHTDL